MTKNTNKFALYLLMFNTFIAMGGIGLVVPVMPAYLETFGVGGTVLGFLIATFAFGQFLFSPIAGDLSDRKGRKQFIVVGLLIFSAAQLLFGVSSHVALLFVARFFSGMGSAFIIAPIMAFVADITTYEDRGRGMGLIGASTSLGFMLGPAFGGFLSRIDIHVPFYCAAIAALLAAIFSAIYLPNVKPSATMVKPPRESIIKQLMRSTKTSYFIFLIVVFTFSFGIANFQGTMAIYFDEKLGYSPTEIAIILTVGGFFGVVLQMFIIEGLFKRYGEMRVILVNLLVASATMLAMIFLHRFFMVVFISTVFSAATTFIRPAVNTLISKLAADEQGYAAGMNNAYLSLGNMIGPALAGILFDWNMDSPYIFGTFILLACFVLAYVWVKGSAPQLMHAEQK